MPDWITHLGTAYAGARMLGVRETPLVLLGAVLPDAVMPAFVLVDLLHLPARETFTYLAPVHSLTIVAVLAAVVALLHAHPSRCFVLVFGGALTHFALDLLETDIDCGMRVFYPFSFRSWSPGWLAPGSAASSALLVAAAIVLAAALWRPHSVGHAFKLKNLRLVALMVALAMALPLLTQRVLVSQNVHFLAFFANPAAWQGRSVDLCVSEVISTDPPQIEEFEREFDLMTSERLELGERVSVRGLYDNGRIYPTRIYIHRGFSEAWLSLVGLIALLVIWYRCATAHRIVKEVEL